MTVNFPAIQPTATSFVMPEWPTSETVSLSGVRSYRLWADKASGAILRLEFANISNANKWAIDTAHQAARGHLEDLSLPAIVFNGVIDAALLAFLQQPGAGTKWYFIKGSPPDGSRVPGRRWTVKVDLRSELRLAA
jgi:hypothetical protein